MNVPRVPLFLTGFVVLWAALSATNAFYSIQLVATGGTGAMVGLAWAIGALVEVPIMYSFPRLARRFGAERLLVTGGLVFFYSAWLSAASGSLWARHLSRPAARLRSRGRSAS